MPMSIAARKAYPVRLKAQRRSPVKDKYGLRKDDNNVFKLYQRGTSGIDAQRPIEKPMQRCADDSDMVTSVND